MIYAVYVYLRHPIVEYFRDERKARDFYASMLVRWPSDMVEFEQFEKEN